MPFSPGWLLLSLVIGCIGTGLFVYGKREVSLPHMVVGGIFVIYPYFIGSLALMAIIAVILGAGLWMAVRMGW